MHLWSLFAWKYVTRLCSQRKKDIAPFVQQTKYETLNSCFVWPCGSINIHIHGNTNTTNTNNNTNTSNNNPYNNNNHYNNNIDNINNMDIIINNTNNNNDNDNDNYTDNINNNNNNNKIIICTALIACDFLSVCFFSWLADTFRKKSWR